jgi:hypothetical protein
MPSEAKSGYTATLYLPDDGGSNLGPIDVSKATTDAQAREIATQQNVLVRLEKKGRDDDAAVARDLLRTLKDSFALQVEQRDRIVQELVDFDRRHPPQAHDDA